jgi:hypothetical protein
MLYVLRNPLTHGAMDDMGEPAAIRARAVNLLKTLSKASSTASRSLMESSASDLDSSIRDIIRLTEVIAGEVYFAAGVHQLGRESLPAIITRPEQTRFYHEAESVFDDLSAIGAPSLAHRLVETLEMYIDTDPRAVFLRVAATVQAGKLWNYEYEELAQTVVLRIVRRYLTDILDEHRLASVEDDDGNGQWTMYIYGQKSWMRLPEDIAGFCKQRGISLDEIFVDLKFDLLDSAGE